MAIATDDLTLLDLRQNGGPVPVANGGRDIELLISQVIELQHHHVTFPAIRARVSLEILD
jgi:hypothetical protein